MVATGYQLHKVNCGVMATLKLIKTRVTFCNVVDNLSDSARNMVVSRQVTDEEYQYEKGMFRKREPKIE